MMIFLKELLIMFLIFVFLFFIFSFHPLTLATLVICQATIVSIILSMFFSFSWFSFIIFMVYLGGILMIFSYIISITFSSEKLFNKMPKNIFLFIIFFPFFMNSKKQEFMFGSKILIKEKLFSSFSYSFELSIFLMSILMLIMILIVFVTESSKNSMRSII